MVKEESGNRGFIIKEGIKGGLWAGLNGVVFFGILTTIYSLVAERDLAGIAVLPYIFIFAIPIGLVVGVLVGLAIAIAVYQSPTALNNIKAVALVVGAMAGAVYPTIGFYLTAASSNPSESREALFSVLIGLVSGGIGGYSGANRFFRQLVRKGITAEKQP